MDRRRAIHAAERGFTLLEVMIAMAILVVALAALLGHEAVAVQMSHFSNRVSQASLLAQGKLLDIEHTLVSESMDSLDSCEEGDFRAEGFRAFKWKACAYKIELGEGAGEAMTEQIMGMLGGLGMPMDPEALQSDPRAAQMMGQVQMAIGAIPTFLQQLEDQVRKVQLEVTWRDATEDRILLVERFVTVLGSDTAGQTPGLTGGTGAGATGTTGGGATGGGTSGTGSKVP